MTKYGRPLKIWFLPNYNYIDMDPFVLVAKELEKIGMQPVFLKIVQHNLLRDEEEFEKIIRNSRFVTIRTFVKANISRYDFISRVAFILRLILLSWQIRYLVRVHRPDAVVTGTDLGGYGNLILCDIADRNNIPLILLITNNVRVIGLEADREKRKSFAKLLLFKLLELVKMLDFHRYEEKDIVPGIFSERSTILVDGQLTQEFLSNHGINLQRIKITGNPIHDREISISQINRDLIREKFLSHLNISANTFVITYISEVIQELYGMKYIKDLNNSLKVVFEKLPDDCKVVIRLHPRESLEVVQNFKRIFSSPRFIFSNEEELYYLFRGSDCVIGHHSTVLESALRLGALIFLLHIRDDKRILLFKEVDSLAVVNSFDELTERLKLLINGEEKFISQLRERLNVWIKACDPFDDGNNSKRVAQLIIEKGLVVCGN